MLAFGRGSYIKGDSIIHDFKDAKNGFARMFETGKFSDVTVSAGPDNQTKVFKCHKAVLANASGYFEKAFYGTVPFSEADNGAVTLPEHDPFIIGKALEFIYTEDYNLGEEECSPVRHAEMFSEGVYLDIKGLRNTSMDRLAFWINWTLTDVHRDTSPEDIKAQVDRVVESLEVVWAKSTAVDRDALILLPVARHFEKIMNHDGFHRLTKLHPDIVLDVLNAYHRNVKYGDSYTSLPPNSKYLEQALVWCGYCEATMAVVCECLSCYQFLNVLSGQLNGSCNKCGKQGEFKIRCLMCGKAKRNFFAF